MIDRTKYIPPITALSGAFVACVATIINEYSNLEMMFIVLAAAILFYIAGAIIRMLALKILVVPESKEEGTQSGEEGSEEGVEVSENSEDQIEQENAQE